MRFIKTRSSKYLLMTGVGVIISLLCLNSIITYVNYQTMQENRLLQKQAEQVKIAVSQAIYLIHNADLALRGYALFKDAKYLPPLYFTEQDKDSIYLTIEEPLRRQNYPMQPFGQLKDSINSYIAQCFYMKQLFDQNRMEEFDQLADLDKGYHLWLQYDQFNKAITLYEDTINHNAQLKYDSAQRNIYLVQFLLLLIGIPTLLITAFGTHQQVQTAEHLRQVQEQNLVLLAEQNVLLEKQVAERTQYILTQNQQLSRQRDELALQNAALLQSKKQQLEAYTQNLAEKTQVIESIQLQLEQLNAQQAAPNEVAERFITILQSTILTEESWIKFKNSFNQVYPDFFAWLRFQYPEITSAELRLAALVRLNLSLKESANMLGISPESVKKARHRLKKKLNIGESMSLDDFIRTISDSKITAD